MIDKALEKEILSNYPRSIEWSDESFLGELQENCIWNFYKYKKLENAIRIVDSGKDEKKFLLQKFFIYARIIRLFASHLDKMDIYEIKNLSRNEILDLWEKIDSIFCNLFS